MSETYSSSDFYKVYKLFTEKNWHIKDGNDEVFQNYCELMGNLSDLEKDLIFNLSSQYLWITFNEYNELLKKALDLVEDEKLATCKRIILLPIIKPEDVGKVKSSFPLLYIFKGMYIASGKYKGISFDILEDPNSVHDKPFKVKESELIFFVDDYLGSGETLEYALNEVLKNTAITHNIINVIALVGQLETIQNLEKKGIKCYIPHKRKKGITDSYTSPELEENIRIMEKIEKMIPGHQPFSFGYNRSEALVTMIRTPDNTFPIFWKTHRKNNIKYKAPFARE
jgi:hypothetical protein